MLAIPSRIYKYTRDSVIVLRMFSATEDNYPLMESLSYSIILPHDTDPRIFSDPL